MKNGFVKIYSELLDKFTREGLVTNYIDVNYCLSREKPISIYFTTKFGEEFQKRTEMSQEEIVANLTEIVPFFKVSFVTDERHKKIAFDNGCRVA